jgi:hypothetical protein
MHAPPLGDPPEQRVDMAGHASRMARACTTRARLREPLLEIAAQLSLRLSTEPHISQSSSAPSSACSWCTPAARASIVLSSGGRRRHWRTMDRSSSRPWSRSQVKQLGRAHHGAAQAKPAAVSNSAIRSHHGLHPVLRVEPGNALCEHPPPLSLCLLPSYAYAACVHNGASHARGECK